MKRTIINLLKRLFDSKRGQRFLKKVHLLVLYLQNYGLSGECDTSGELNVIKRMGAQLSKKKNPVIFDIGANVGKYITYLDKYLTTEYRAFCFEPSKNTFNELIKNVGENKHVRLVNEGLGDQQETLTLYSNDQSHTQSSVIKRDMSHWDESYNLVHEETVVINTLENFCKENNIEYIDFMKVDVEGYEMKMFAGAKSFIDLKKIGAIQFELGVASVDGKYFFKDVFHLLHTNYKIYRITFNNLYEITHYSEQFEVFLTTNYLAIAR